MGDLKIAHSHLEAKIDTLKEKLSNCSVNNELMITGKYIGAKISLSILDGYVNREKLTRTDIRKISRTANDYIVKADKIAEKFNINIFAYEFALSTITKTTGLLIGDIDLEKFLQD